MNRFGTFTRVQRAWIIPRGRAFNSTARNFRLRTTAINSVATSSYDDGRGVKYHSSSRSSVTSGEYYYSKYCLAPPCNKRVGNVNHRKLGVGGLQRQLSSGTSSSFSTTAEGKADNNSRVMEFQAETRQLLDIVTHSIYTDKEVFLRELISNASDAMEKLRHLQIVRGGDVDWMADAGLPSEISVEVNPEAKTVTIEDHGIGMNHDELVSNLGTIARSGSKAFVEELKEKAGPDASSTDALRDIIGRFGLGFYSAFMVGDKVEVTTKSAEGGIPCKWSSDGSGQYSIENLKEDEQLRGSKSVLCSENPKVVIHLRDGCEEFAERSRVLGIIKKYSNFVGVPIKLNGEVVNTVDAIWTKLPAEVEEEKYLDFYRFISHAGPSEEPLAKLHFQADAPIDLKALFFIPTFHTEKFGMGRMEPGVNLYCRKVLIENKIKDLLPEWLRFIKGVVDSEDLPLSISREKPQDTALLRKIGNVLTRKVIRFLQDMQKKEPEKYKEKFYSEFGFFIKEGICQDYGRQADLAKLLYFESSKDEPGKLCSLDDYVGRLEPEQKEIYYLMAPNRDLAEASPYFETFKRSNREVLFVYNPIDEFVMANLSTYNDRSISSCETEAQLVEPDDASSTGESESTKSQGTALNDEEAKDLCNWLEGVLDGVESVQTTKRLEDSPAIIEAHQSGALHRMMRAIEQSNSGKKAPKLKQKLFINPRNSIMVRLNTVRKFSEATAILVAEQVLDNALIAAGLLDDPRVMTPRLNAILLKNLELLQHDMPSGDGHSSNSGNPKGDNNFEQKKIEVEEPSSSESKHI